MKRPNFEATFRRILEQYESSVREHQMELMPDYRAAYAKDVKWAQNKIIQMFRTVEENADNYRNALKYIINESMDPPVAQFARDILYPKKKKKR